MASPAAKPGSAHRATRVPAPQVLQFTLVVLYACFWFAPSDYPHAPPSTWRLLLAPFCSREAGPVQRPGDSHEVGDEVLALPLLDHARDFGQLPLGTLGAVDDEAQCFVPPLLRSGRSGVEPPRIQRGRQLTDPWSMAARST